MLQCCTQRFTFLHHRRRRLRKPLNMEILHSAFIIRRQSIYLRFWLSWLHCKRCLLIEKQFFACLVVCRNRFFFVLKLSDVNNWYAKQPPLKFQATPISRRKIFRRSLNRWNIEQQIIKHHSILNIDIAPCRLKEWGDCRVMSRSEMELLNKKISYVIIIITISKKKRFEAIKTLSFGSEGAARNSRNLFT